MSRRVLTPSSMIIIVMVRPVPTFMPATTIIMHIAPPVIVPAEKEKARRRQSHRDGGRRHHHPDVRRPHYHLAAVTSIHETHTSQQESQQRNPRADFDSVNCAGRGCRRDQVTEPQLRVPVLFNIHGHKITPDAFPALWGVTPPGSFSKRRGACHSCHDADDQFAFRGRHAIRQADQICARLCLWMLPTVWSFIHSRVRLASVRDQPACVFRTVSVPPGTQEYSRVAG